MGRKRRNFQPEFKAKVALEALKERHTLTELATKWKKELLKNLS
jgi:transposase-like protein